MSGRPGDRPAARDGRAGRGGWLRLGVDRRLDHRAAAPRAAHADGRPRRAHAARAARHRRAAARAAPTRSSWRMRRRHARPRGRGPRDPRRRHRRRHARPIREGVRRHRRAFERARRPLPRDARDLPRAVEPRQRRASAASTSRSTARRVEPKPHRAGGPPIWIGGSGPTASREAARFDAWFPTGPSVEFFAEHFPKIQAGGARPGGSAGAVSRRRVPHAGARRQPPPPPRRGWISFSRRTTPRRRARSRRARHGTPDRSKGCAEWIQRWIDAGARHLRAALRRWRSARSGR
mgnify:CR=1 FL=1